METLPPFDGETPPRPRRRSSSLAENPLISSSRSRPAADGASNLDPDTCRICRGEATPTEPLFYPCKCSGSIKYVHQDCLMEWLSHSQKKHCELCKTSFRFTKLYSPSMPKKLPVFVFLRHMAKYILRNILVWFRVSLVVSVWLGWLPYLTRWEWSFFFWISEEGLVSPNRIAEQEAILRNASASLAAAAASAALPSTASVCLSSPLLSSTSSLASAAAQTGILANGQYAANATTGEPLYSILLRLLADFVGSDDGLSNSTGSSDAITAMGGPPTLLGEVSFLRNLTRYPAINKAVIYTLEGQIITVLVIICFILVILVRDYVVQQQPEIVMRQAFAAQAAEDNAAPALVQDGGRIPGADLGLLDEETEWETDSDLMQEDDNDHHHPAGLRRHEHHHADHREADQQRHVPAPEPLPIFEAEDMPFGFQVVGHNDNRPASEPISATRASSPTLEPLIQRGDDDDELDDAYHNEPSFLASRVANSLAGPSHIPQPELLKNFSNPGEGATVQEYLRIYREAGGDPDKIWKIAREEGLEDRLQYWLRLTQQVMDKKKQSDKDTSDGDESSEDAGSSASHSDDAASSFPKPPVIRREWYEDSSDDEANEDISDLPSVLPSMLPPTFRDKGKGRADETEDAAETADHEEHDEEDEEEEEEEEDLVAEFGGGDIGSALRRRANTDGPVRKEGANPLANNNWSFPELRPSNAATSSGRDLPNHHSASYTHKDTAGDMFTSSDSDDSLVTPDTSNGQPDANGGSSENDNHQHQPEVLAEMAPLRPAPRPTNNEPTDANERETREGRHNHNHHDNEAADVPTPTAEAAPAPRRARPIGLFGRIANFMWQDLDDIDPADLPPIGPEPFFEIEDGPFDDPEPRPEMGENFEQDREVMEAAAAAGLDAEAIDDAEDLEGVMELLGMRGPVAALFQNAIFCAFLVTVTLLLGIFLPYNIGRLTVWLIANPMRPVMMLFSLSKFLQDMAAVALGGIAFAMFYVLSILSNVCGRVVGLALPTGPLASSLAAAWNVSASAARRIVESFIIEPPVVLVGDIRNFSAISHEALVTLKGHVASAFATAGQGIVMLTSGDILAQSAEGLACARGAAAATWAVAKTLPALLSKPGSWVITLDSLDPVTVNPAFAYWDSADRSLAIMLGYTTMCLVAGLYLQRNTPLSDNPTGNDWEASVMEGLNQASGVMKVILIIGIEMLVFPLYCGLLLDVALLPLFENTTLLSRLAFTLNYPLTSIFVHWFVGTGYMFHFALFVSMCRKIMRKGVLYFIRDPDDPEFHPVRDVLERTVTTQLRKILFSAFVYGALVLICLGGIVWGMALAAPGMLPIHYSSNEPVLEFPIDLLFYNFLMPLAIKFFKPSDGLHVMYTWWFRKSARILRITWFLFGERKVDEEGQLTLRPKSPYWDLPRWRRVFLEYRDHGEVRPKPWKNVLFDFEGGTAKPRSSISRVDMVETYAEKHHLVHSRQLIPDGRFVRAPASDQVKIPKGRAVFLPVTESNLRTDEMRLADGTTLAGATGDLYSSNQYQLVYIPPHFRLRVFLFILFIWMFAAVTGVSFTIVPLLFGRCLFQVVIPSHIRTNDIYAFSIGMYVLGSALYMVFHARAIAAKATDLGHRAAASVTAHTAVRKTAALVLRGLKLVYTYFFILVVFPLLATALVELYILIPLHTYMYPPGAVPVGADAVAASADAAGGAAVDDSRHTVRIIQSWTLGLLYVKLGTRTVTTWYPETRMASAIRAVLRRGRMDPDVHLLTRAFVVPGLVLAVVTIVLPPLMLAFMGDPSGGSANTDGIPPALMYRLSYPFVALNVAVAWMLWGLVDIFSSWKVRIRDEVYLIGERLHNFGATNGNSARRAWKAGGHRL